MPVKPKLNAKLYSYLILALQIAFSSWSWLFLFFATYSLNNVKHGGLISAILFLSNAVVRAAGAQRLAYFAQRYKEQTRLHISLFIKLLFLFSLLLLPYIGGDPILLILWTTATNVLLVLDSYLSFHVRYFFADASHITLVRYNTLSNLGSRGSVALVSMIAFSLGKNNWLKLTEICIFLAFTGFIASCLSIFYARAHNAVERPISPVGQQILNETTANKIAILGAHFLFLMNLFFGAGALLFARAIPEYGLEIYGLNLITFFYLGFIFVIIFITLFERRINVFITWRNLISSYFLVAILGCFFYTLRFDTNLCCILAIIWGGVYSWGLTAFFPLISKQIRGKNQATLFAKIDSESRLGFIISQLGTGILLDALIGPLQLLQLYCLSAIIGLILLLALNKNKLEMALSYESSI